ncbi:polygalacturonase [Paenibacillus taihuensis]|uniref:Polygalacturonase n=1 Tax=Paenibacillus taihuensis TaxID=1156355 RepID=A0A3D9SDK8_9BACL|nr:sugar-binding protein [Paenibacillus taihuensis]REE87480.1 polygalacturonase [Paenibacillus taihuensis]
MRMRRTLSTLLSTALLSMPAVTYAAEANTGITPTNAISITEFGATPNDGTDDLAAINKALSEAAATGKSVYVPEGTFLFSDSITLNGVDLSGTGPTSILKSTNLERQAVVLSGNGSDLSRVKLTTVPAATRLTTDISARVIAAETSTNYSIKDIEIDGGSSAGIFNLGSHGVISGNIVKNTLADGIHMTGRSNDILVERNEVRDNGDDHIAVVSYEKFGDWCKNITIRNNEVSGGHARGITVSGGENVTIENNKIDRTGGAGIFIASEGNWQTYAVTNLSVKNNTISNTSLNGSVAEKGGIRLQATYKDPGIQNAIFENNKVSGSKDSGILLIGSDQIFATFKGNTVENAAAYGIYILKTVKGEITFANNVVTGSKSGAFYNLSTAAKVTSDLKNEAPGASENGNSSDYVAVKGTPVIDGKADALWDNSTALQLNTDDYGTTGTARIAWDDRNLYYLFDMKDSTPNAAAENENNDSVEVWVDELNAKHGARGTGDYQLRADLKNALSSTEEGWDLTAIKSAVTKSDGGYMVEFAVPYRALSPKPGDSIGFNASANDDANGDGKRDTYVSWIDKNLPYWADTKVYNQVQLIDQKPVSLPKAVYGKPVIDGKIDGLWKNASVLQMDQTDKGTTGTARIAWDENALYYLFEMKDATPNAAGTNENNDSVEVWVDELNAKHGARAAGDYQLRVDLKNAISTTEEGWDLSAIKSAVTQGSGSYIVEFAVPYTALNPKAGGTIGFNASANDDADGDGKRDNYVSWIDKNLPYWADTKVYNEVVLEAPAQSGGKPLTVTVEGNAIKFTAEPVAVHGRVAVQADALIKALGGTYAYDTRSGTITIGKGASKIVLKLRAATAQVNGKKIALAVPAEVSGGTVTIPLRFIAENLGYAVGWDQAGKAITISKKH